ncbi:unnamed protein product [Miscanthus lutarioriparius]|uniref:Autophagy protein 5 n=1 Tax=Miscanthus lutarioriparius TaxID=422564 RepID=A0A811PS20_9POAL|nr:unnamed protein product [Miscanthus lutarioriparius]
MAAPHDEAAAWSEEAARRVWAGAVPLQVHLHDADVTALPPPPPFLTLGPRIGYLPLLIPVIKAHFSNALPPGVDTVWFEYKGLPLKWGYPSEILSPCEGEDSVKWSYMNSLKEATFIITGNNKSVMNMSHADQVALWESVMKGNLDGYKNISTRLKLGPFEDDGLVRTASMERQRQQNSDEPESPGSSKPCRVPVRLYVRNVQEELEYIEDAIPVSDWESVSYINRPFEIRKVEEFFRSKPAGRADDSQRAGALDSAADSSDATNSSRSSQEAGQALASPREAAGAAKKAKVKLVRVQGIELDMDIPFLWVANNLKNPEYYLHICVYVGTRKQ